MKKGRKFNEIMKKRVRPLLLVLTLLVTMGINAGVTSAADTLPSYSNTSDDSKYVTIAETAKALDSTERSFQVTLKVTNKYSENDDSHNKLQNVMVSEPVNSNFIISDVSSNATASNNVISLKQAQTLSKGAAVTITYTVTAKNDDVSGQLLLNGDMQKTNVSFTYSYDNGWWFWEDWQNENGSKDFTSPTVYVKPIIKPGEIKFTKTAAPVEGQEDKYKITFNISGQLKEMDPKKADIVILIDNSNSMSNSMSTIKKAADNLCKELLTKDQVTGENLNKNHNIRVSVQTFGTNVKERCDFNSDYASVSKAIQGISANGGGTNTQAGIAAVNSKIGDSQKNNSDAERFVILFTDGLPTYGESGGNGGYPSQQKFFGDAQYQYDKVVGGIALEHLGKMMDASGKWVDVGDTSRSNYKYTTPSNLPVVTDSKTAFYSIGLYPTDGNNGHQLTTKKNWMEGFLYSIQNAESDRKTFVDNYCKNDATEVTGVFENISNSIKQKMSKIIEDATLTDTLSGDFSFTSDMAINNPTGVTVTVNGADKTTETNAAAAKDGKTFVKSISGRQIDFNVDYIPQSADKDNKVNISISFIVDAVDPYLSGSKLETNEGKAVLNYTDGLSNLKNQKQYADPATVSVNPTEGKTSVQKVVVDENNNVLGEDKSVFPIYLERTKGSDGYHDKAWTSKNNDTAQKYGFELTGNSSDAISYYLRGNSTRVDSETDASKNYITAGTYTIRETVPMDYELKSIEYYNPSTKQWVDITANPTITLVKKTPNVSIRVTNIKHDNSYWRDRDDTANIMTYTK